MAGQGARGGVSLGPGCGNLGPGVWQPGARGVVAWVWRNKRSVAQKLKLVMTLMRKAGEASLDGLLVSGSLAVNFLF